MKSITKLMASVTMLLVLSLATSCETLVNYLDTPQTPETPIEDGEIVDTEVDTNK